MPYLKDTKIAVEFNNITINTDYQLINGVVETSYDPNWKNVVDIKEVANDFKELINGIADLFDRANKLEDQKAAGTIKEEDYNKNWKDIYTDLEKANEHYKTLANAPDVPKELKKKIADLDPVFVELASNNFTTKGNQNKENLEKTNLAYDELNKFVSNNCQDLDDEKIVLQDLSEYKIYGTPAGKYFVLKGAANVDLESIYPNETYPDLKVPKGALVAFTSGRSVFKAKYRKEANKWKFTGYFNGETEYLDTDTAEFKSKYGAGNNSQQGFALVLGTGASTELSKSVLVSLGETAGLTAEGAVIFRSITGTAMLAYIIIETFVVTSTVTSVSGDVLDLPVTTPIVAENVDDGELKDIPVDLPITAPISIPHKIDDTKGGCSVYVIFRVSNQTGKFEVAKYGITCVTDNNGIQCDNRPDSQTKIFNTSTEAKYKNGEYKYNWTWLFQDLSEANARLIERSLTGMYIAQNKGELPPMHKLPCFKRIPDSVLDAWEREQALAERINRVKKYFEEMILKYGTK